MENQITTPEQVTNVVTITNTENSAEKKRLGRPIVPGSKRQERINDLESRRANGTLKLGRPSNSESNRQKRIAERQYKIENGIAIKRGRPKVKKDETAENKEA